MENSCFLNLMFKELLRIRFLLRLIVLVVIVGLGNMGFIGMLMAWILAGIGLGVMLLLKLLWLMGIRTMR
jgi:hypothetical protein